MNVVANPVSQTVPREGWVEAPPQTTEALSGTFWRLADLDGRVLAPFLVLSPEGLVGNVFSDQMECWQVVNGRLCLIDKGGLPAIVFNVAELANGRPVAFAGRAIIGGVDAVYALQRTTHPAAMVMPGAERRATFLKQPASAGRRPNLIVLRSNSASLHPHWLEGVDDRTRSWDLCISSYENTPPDTSMVAEYLVHAPNQRKFKPIFDLFHDGSPLWGYDRIWLPDDDLLCSGRDINRMFHLSRKYGLDLSQPSLVNGPGSHINHPVTAQRPGGGVRLSPFVEIMCPLFSRRALEICIGSLKEAISGYGLDHLWPSFLGRSATRIGIIDAVAVAHTRPIGASYDVRSAIGEQAALWKAYGFKYAPIEGVR
jgi:hypothetical protein